MTGAVIPRDGAAIQIFGQGKRLSRMFWRAIAPAYLRALAVSTTTFGMFASSIWMRAHIFAAAVPPVRRSGRVAATAKRRRARLFKSLDP